MPSSAAALPWGRRGQNGRLGRGVGVGCHGKTLPLPLPEIFSDAVDVVAVLSCILISQPPGLLTIGSFHIGLVSKKFIRSA